MDLVSIVGVVALAVSTGGGDGPVPAAQPTLPEPISTRQNLFSIPFQVDESADPEQEPVEVQLHVSVDRGATWHFYSKVEPKRGYFLFRAGGDGEFWFLIRTLDRNGNLRPEETSMPGLRVVVDTTPPKLELKASRGQAGQVTAEWQVNDPNFDLASLKIQYRTGENPMWQHVAVDRRSAQAEGAVHRGEASWWLPADASRIEIRAEAADSAANPTVTHAQIAGDAPPAVSVPTTPYSPAPTEVDTTVDKVARSEADSAWRPSTDSSADESWRSRAMTEPPGQDAVADRTPSYTFPPSEYSASPSPYEYATSNSATQNGVHSQDQSPLRVDQPAPQPEEAASNPRYAAVSPSTVGGPNVKQSRAGNRQIGQTAPNAQRTEVSRPMDSFRDAPDGLNDSVAEVPRYPSTDPAEASRRLTPGMSAADRLSADETTSLPEPDKGSVAIQIHPAIRNQYASTASGRAEFDTSMVPPGEAVRMVGSRVFELEYDVESVGPSGIAQVELWGTRDGGRTWSSFGVDEDNRSPLLVTVQEEGIYGFRVAVKNGAGMGGRRPQSGDKPDLWIGVDETKPSAQILGAGQAGGNRPGEMLIRWKADDPMLDEQPVSLYYSDTADGPWKPIAKDLENSGQFAWSPDGPASQRVFLRLEVRDRAGNLATSQTNTAISLDGLQPVVRIRDVRPLSRSAETPPQQYFYR